MANGFGFSPNDSSDDDDKPGENPPNGANFDINQIFEQMRAMGLPTPELPDHVKDQLNALTAMAQGMINNSQNPDGSTTPFNLPINVIRDISRRTLATSGERPVGHLDNDAMKGALRLADLWIDAVTALPKSTITEDHPLHRFRDPFDERCRE